MPEPDKLIEVTLDQNQTRQFKLDYARTWHVNWSYIGSEPNTLI